MDMFPDTALIREIQQELDSIIQQGVQNITRLLRANDPTVTASLLKPGSQQAIGGGASSSHLTGSKGQKGQRGSREAMESPLAGRLVRDGLLTPDLLRQLQREWSKAQKQEATDQSALDTGHHDDNHRGKSRRKKK